MKFTKGLFLGTAVGMTAAMIMNNKSRMSGSNNSNNSNKSDITANAENQTNDYIVNDII